MERKNKRGFELAVSTLIVIVIAVIVLVAIVLALMSGFERFQSATEPVSESAGSAGC